jgi:hypothetical protein
MRTNTRLGVRFQQWVRSTHQILCRVRFRPFRSGTPERSDEPDFFHTAPLSSEGARMFIACALQRWNNRRAVAQRFGSMDWQRKKRVSRDWLRCLLSCSVLFALVSCGGGGSADNPGPGGPGAAAAPRLVLSRTSISVSAPVTSSVPPTSSITVSVENDHGANLYIRERYSNKGIADVSSTRDNGPLEILLSFKAPHDLPPATYDDSMVFQLCSDGNCSSLVGTPVTVPIRYEVVASSVTPGVAISTSSLTLHALITDARVPGVSDPVLSFTGLQTVPFVKVTSTGTAVGNPFFLPALSSNLAGGTLIADLKSPSDLGPGTFDGVVSVSACLDANCVNPLAGSPLTLSVQLTVSDHVDGPNGYRVRIVDAFAADMVWDATRQLLYLASPDTSPNGTAHRILVVDPATASVVGSKALPSRPLVLAGSPDDQYLYVASAPAALQRLRMSDLSPDASIPLGTSPRGTDYFARQISVSPDDPLTIAVARSTNLDTPANGGLVIFDDMTPRPSVLAEQSEFSNVGPFMDRITWGADSSVLFATNVSSTAPQLYALQADGTGARIERTISPLGVGQHVHFDSNRLYTDYSELFDPATLGSMGKFISTTNQRFPDSTTLDVPGNRAFVTWLQLGGAVPSPRYLSSFDLGSQAEIASLGLHQDWSPKKVLRIGSNRLALLVVRSTDMRVVLIDGPFVGP